MRLVVDANIVISALMRQGITRKMEFDNRLELFAPITLIDEMRKYYLYVEKKSGMKKDDFARLFTLILKRIAIENLESLRSYLAAAKTLTVDEKDEQYAACALAINAEIWSNDKGFRTGRVRVWST